MLKTTTSVINASQITGVLPVLNGGTGVTTSTGTGNTVLSASPTLSGDVTLSTGNLVIGTAGKGIDFTVTSSGSGTMTSELLADYEEGDWTPNQGAGLTVIGTFSSSGKYTKIGRQVTLGGIVSGSTSVSVVAAGLICTNTPFISIPPYGNGSAGNQNNDVSITVLQAGTSVYANGTVAATANIYFTVTYFV